MFIGLSGQPVLAQPFRAQTVPPGSPSPEARQSFQAKIDEQTRLLASDPRLKRVPQHKQRALVEFMVGNVLFVAIRELGRALLSEMNLPTLTGVQQAADDFAVLTALELGQKNFSDRILIEATKGWFTSVRREKRARSTPHYYDRHGLNVRRAYRIVCLMVGADPVRFKALAEETTLPGEVRRTCGWDYDRASRSWETVLMPHRPAADQPRTRIAVIYGVATGNLEVYGQLFRNLRFLETIAELAADRFAWRTPILMEMRTCGDADATWTIPTRTLRVCYEMAEDFAELYLDFGPDKYARSGLCVAKAVAKASCKPEILRSQKRIPRGPLATATRASVGQRNDELVGDRLPRVGIGGHHGRRDFTIVPSRPS